MRTIVVTGGGTGIGRAVAERFAADGDTVTTTGRRADVLAATADEVTAGTRGSGGSVRAVAFDATDAEQVEAALEQLPARVDVLVTNAGGNTDFAREGSGGLPEVAAAWRANLDANVLSAVLVTTALRDRLVPGGAVINLGSIAADKGAGSYGAAKAAVAAWTVTVAGELGPHDITVNTVAPGYVADTEFFGDRLSGERRDALVSAAATRRPSRPGDVAELVSFLASPGARQITGQSLAVNGGERTTR